MKNFDDFLTPALANEIDNIAETSSKEALSGLEHLPEGQRVATATSAASIAVTIELLKRYHEWLNS